MHSDCLLVKQFYLLDLDFNNANYFLFILTNNQIWIICLYVIQVKCTSCSYQKMRPFKSVKQKEVKSFFHWPNKETKLWKYQESTQKVLAFLASKAIYFVSLSKHKNKTMKRSVKFSKINYFCCKQSHIVSFTKHNQKTMEISVSCRGMDLLSKRIALFMNINIIFVFC